MTLEAGWLKRQLDRVANDVEKWPEWMKREAEFASQDSGGGTDQERFATEAPITLKVGGNSV